MAFNILEFKIYSFSAFSYDDAFSTGTRLERAKLLGRSAGSGRWTPL